MLVYACQHCVRASFCLQLSPAHPETLQCLQTFKGSINHNIKSALPEVYELAYLYAEVIKSAPCIWSTGYQATQQVLSLTKARHIILLSCASSPCTHTHITGELLSHVKLFNWNIKPDLDNRTYYSINTNN